MQCNQRFYLELHCLLLQECAKIMSECKKNRVEHSLPGFFHFAVPIVHGTFQAVPVAEDTVAIGPYVVAYSAAPRPPVAHTHSIFDVPYYAFLRLVVRKLCCR